MVKEYKETFGSHNKLCEAKRLPDDINHSVFKKCDIFSASVIRMSVKGDTYVKYINLKNKHGTGFSVFFVLFCFSEM